jgi:hypothetical protein
MLSNEILEACWHGAFYSFFSHSWIYLFINALVEQGFAGYKVP